MNKAHSMHGISVYCEAKYSYVNMLRWYNDAVALEYALI